MEDVGIMNYCTIHVARESSFLSVFERNPNYNTDKLKNPLEQINWCGMHTKSNKKMSLHLQHLNFSQFVHYVRKKLYQYNINYYKPLDLFWTINKLTAYSYGHLPMDICLVYMWFCSLLHCCYVQIEKSFKSYQLTTQKLLLYGVSYPSYHT